MICGYQLILVQRPGIAHQDKNLCRREQSDEHHIYCKYHRGSSLLSQAPFLIDIQGNIATGMRQFGIIIDQARLHQYLVAVPKVDFFLMQIYPNTLGNPGKGVVISVRVKILLHLCCTYDYITYNLG